MILIICENYCHIITNIQVLNIEIVLIALEELEDQILMVLAAI